MKALPELGRNKSLIVKDLKLKDPSQTTLESPQGGLARKKKSVD